MTEHYPRGDRPRQQPYYGDDQPDYGDQQWGRQPAPATPPRRTAPPWYRRAWVIALAMLIIGFSLGSLTSGDAEPAAADAQPAAATPGSCMRALDLADAGQATPGAGEYGHMAADCRSKAAEAPAAGGPPAAEPAPEAPAEAEADQQGYLDALTVIDPGLTVDADQAVGNGENVCLDIEQGKDRTTVVDNARQRFTGGSAIVDAVKAQQIVTATHQHLCPTATLPPVDPVAMPDVVHYTYADAIGILEAAGVPAEAIEQVALGEDSIALNPFNWIVLEVTPAAGETWQPGSPVRLGIVKRGDPKAAGIQPRLE